MKIKVGDIVTWGLQNSAYKILEISGNDVRLELVRHLRADDWMSDEENPMACLEEFNDNLRFMPEINSPLWRAIDGD